MSAKPRPTKICRVCGRSFAWRRKWARDWENVRYCSAACRKSGVDDTDHKLEGLIVSLLSQRSRSATICPSEVAQAASENNWRELMEPVRRAARRLAADGRVDILQRGRKVDPDNARGPIRLRLARDK